MRLMCKEPFAWSGMGHAISVRIAQCSTALLWRNAAKSSHPRKDAEEEGRKEVIFLFLSPLCNYSPGTICILPPTLHLESAASWN